MVIECQLLSIIDAALDMQYAIASLSESFIAVNKNKLLE